ERRLDGWMRAVRAPEGGVLAFTLSVPDPDGGSRGQVALDSAGHGLWDWDIGVDRIFRSDSWLAMLGYSTEDAPDNGLETAMALVHPDDIERVRASVQEHLTGRADAYVCEHRVRRRDGGWRWVRDSGRVVAWSADGRPLRMRSEEHTSELQSRENLVCRLLLEKKKKRDSRQEKQLVFVSPVTAKYNCEKSKASETKESGYMLSEYNYAK